MKKLGYIAIFACIILAGCALWGAKHVSKGDGGIIFSHKKHIEIEAECGMCHAAVTESESSSDNNYPKEDDCLSCHEREECSLCHINVDEAAHLMPEPTRFIFSHKTHLENAEHKMECLMCHSQVAESTNAADQYPIRIKMCLSCHEVVDDNCALCHYSLGMEDFTPASHDSSWLQRHRLGAFADGEKFCSNCHRGRIRSASDEMPPVTKGHAEGEAVTCAECHRGDIWPEEIHDSNYLYLHGADALGNQTVCNSCHQHEECLTCHEARSISFASVHPAGWQSDHAEKARRQAQNCVTCHREEDCLACHQAFSPHPSDWYDKHRGIARGNKTVCSKCHVGFCSRCHD